MLNSVKSFFFGNYDFLQTGNISEYWISKYKITKIQLEAFLEIIFVIFIGSSIIHFFFNEVDVKFIIVEFIVFFLCLRAFNYVVQIQFRNFNTKLDIIGYFVLNELLIILKTSKSLKDAVCFISEGNYLYFSEIFRNALVNCHFGPSLSDSLRTQLVNIISGELRRHFLNILSTWENGNNIAKLSNKIILNHLSEYITEETDKVNILGSLFSGLVFLSPPVILTLLLISGLLDYILGFFLIIFMIFGSFFFRPDQRLSVFFDQSPLLPFIDQKTAEFFMILADFLINGLSFENSMNIALDIYSQNYLVKENISKKDSLVSHKLGLYQNISKNHHYLIELFSPRTIQILFLIEKFSTISSYSAGLRLKSITDELNKIASLLQIGTARLNAVMFQNKIIQLFSIASLGFLAGINQLFIIVSNSIRIGSTINSYNQNYDILLILIGIVMSALPIHNIKTTGSNKNFLFPKGFIFRFSKFLIFLIIAVVTRNYLSSSF